LPILHTDLIAQGWATDHNFAEALAIGQIGPGQSGVVGDSFGLSPRWSAWFVARNDGDCDTTIDGAGRTCHVYALRITPGSTRLCAGG
jgi:hypothetical protein